MTRLRAMRLFVTSFSLLSVGSAPTLLQAQADTTVAAPLPPVQAPDSLPAAERDPLGRFVAGASFATLDLDSLRSTGVNPTTLAEALAGRVPGVSVLRSSGTTGAAARILIRGMSGVTTSGDPLIVVDGLPLEAPQVSPGALLAMRQTSRVDDIYLEDVERIDVLRGPAATSLYGTNAANGVIRLTTRRAGTVTPASRAYAAAGPVLEPTAFPANYQMTGTNTATGAPASDCRLQAVASGACAPGALQTWSPLEEASPFRTGVRQRTGVSVARGGDLAYYSAAHLDRERSVYDADPLRRIALRTNVAWRATPTLGFGTHIGYVTSVLGVPRTDVFLSGTSVPQVLLSGLLGHAADDSIRGYLYRPQGSSTARQHVHRVDGTASADWRPRPGLAMHATLGADYLHLSDAQHDSGNACCGLGVATTDIRGAARDLAVTAAVAATASYTLARRLHGTSAVGIELRHAHLHRTTDTLFTQDQSSGYSQRQLVTDIDTKGLYARQQLALREHLLATVGARVDANDVVERLKTALYPSASLVWDLGGESFFPSTPALSGVQLRAAYGEAGDESALRSRAFGGSAFTPLVPGVPNWKVERSRELELGFDATSLAERLTVGVTYYRKTTRDGLSLFPYSPLLGGSLDASLESPVVRNSGVEAELSARIIAGPQLSWDLAVMGSSNQNTLVDIGSGPPILLFAGFGTIQQRVQDGHALGAYWVRPYTYRDLDGDGVIESSEVTVADSFIDVGGGLPEREVMAATTVTFFQRLTLSALVDHRGGYKKFNGNEAWRCAVENCRAVQDPSAPLAEQARAVALTLTGSATGGGYVGEATGAGFFENASFVRLRELAVSMRVPGEWSRLIGARTVRFTVSGQNLALWTKYSGLDPEVGVPNEVGFPTGEFSNQPLVRYYTARLDVDW